MYTHTCDYLFISITNTISLPFLFCLFFSPPFLAFLVLQSYLLLLAFILVGLNKFIQ